MATGGREACSFTADIIGICWCVISSMSQGLFVLPQIHISIAQVLFAAVAGWTIAALWRVLHLRKCRSCACLADPDKDRRPMSWHGQLVEAATFPVVILVALPIGGRPSFSTIVVLAAVFALRTVPLCGAIIKQRPQFTLSGLFAFTTLVACVCSASHYVPLVPLLAFLYLPVMEWARQHACHCESGIAGFEAESIGETTEAIITSRCERNVKHAWGMLLRPACLLVIVGLGLMTWICVLLLHSP